VLEVPRRGDQCGNFLTAQHNRQRPRHEHRLHLGHQLATIERDTEKELKSGDGRVECDRGGAAIGLIHPKFVRPFVKTNKNDWNDAAAICEAAQRLTRRFVAVKSLEQQDLLALHRIRARLGAQRTGLCNQIRGLLAEYGIVLPVTVPRLRRALPEVLEDPENELTVQTRQAIASLREQLCALDERIKPYESQIEQASVDSEACRRLGSIPGVGPISATAVVATQLWREVQLGRISRRGDVYIRRILIQGAHTCHVVADNRIGRTPRLNFVMNA